MFVEPNNHFGWLLKWLLGNVSSALDGAAVSTYRHTFTGADALKSFTMAVGWDAINARQLIGCIVDALSVECVKGAPLTATANILGKKETLETVGTPTFGDLDAFEAYQATPKIKDSAETIVEAFRINVANNMYPVSDVGVLGDRYLPRAILRERVITGSMDLTFLDAGDYKDFLGDAAAVEPTVPLDPIDLELFFNTLIEPEAGFPYRLEFDLPRVVYTGGDVHIIERERQTLRIDWTAEYDPTATYDLQVELVNEVVSYPDAT